MKYILLIIVALGIIGGGWWFLEERTSKAHQEAEMQRLWSEAEQSMGKYEYTCTDGSGFAMTPSVDLGSIRLEPIQADFKPMVLTSIDGVGARFEGGGMVFVGAGEGVSLTVGEKTHTCTPKPNPDMAPWNWGDQGEGGGVKQDTALIVSESIQGKWQSTDDAKFVRVFKAENAMADLYGGATTSEGLFAIFTKANAPEVSAPLEEGAVYLQITDKQGTSTSTLTFKMVTLTPETLEMIYLDGGGMLRFSRVE